MREERAGGDLFAKLLPREAVCGEVFGFVLRGDKEDEVRVADVDHRALDVADARQFDGTGHDAGDAHLGADDVGGVGDLDDLAGARTAVGDERDLVEAFGRGEPGGDAAGAVAGELGLGAVGVEKPDK